MAPAVSQGHQRLGFVEESGDEYRGAPRHMGEVPGCSEGAPGAGVSFSPLRLRPYTRVGQMESPGVPTVNPFLHP